MDERGKSGEGRRSRAHEFGRLVLGVPTDDLGLRVEESSVGRRRERAQRTGRRSNRDEKGRIELTASAAAPDISSFTLVAA